MEIHIVDDYREMSEKAAAFVAEQLRDKNNSVLGLATGSTPEGMYKKLVEMYKKSCLDFSMVTTFNLDEYVGLSPEHPQSYYAYMHKHFLNHTNIKPENINLPCLNENEADITRVCRDYDQKIDRAGGIDLQILGIGVNGHIGFNEPAKSLPVGTYLVELSAETIEANSRFFSSPEEVPRKAITMGIGPIMHAKKILLLASGKSKATAIRDSFKGYVTTEVPASLLQLHSNSIILIDKDAASLL